jgi:hypothetical protein
MEPLIINSKRPSIISTTQNIKAHWPADFKKSAFATFGKTKVEDLKRKKRQK